MERVQAYSRGWRVGRRIEVAAIDGWTQVLSCVDPGADGKTVAFSFREGQTSSTGIHVLAWMSSALFARMSELGVPQPEPKQSSISPLIILRNVRPVLRSGLSGSVCVSRACVSTLLVLVLLTLSGPSNAQMSPSGSMRRSPADVVKRYVSLDQKGHASRPPHSIRSCPISSGKRSRPGGASWWCKNDRVRGLPAMGDRE